MKKVIIAVAALFACLSLSAQRQGEKSIAVSFGASFGREYVKAYDGVTTTSSSNPMTSSFIVLGEFGYFIADNVRLSMAVGLPFNSTPSTDNGVTWLTSRSIGVKFNPNIAYYVRLADNFYYTPEVGFSYSLGSIKQELTTLTTHNLKYNGWDVYANILALEYRASQKVAIAFGIGSMGYTNVKFREKGASDEYTEDGQFYFNFNTAVVSVRFYF